MTSTEYFERLRSYLVVAIALAIIPALISFLIAVWSAVTTGHVLVVAIGKTETARQLVPWSLGWARFASPLVLVAAGAAYPGDSSPTNLRSVLFSALAITGIGMLCYSLWFTTLRGMLLFYGLALYVASAYFIDLVFGRRAVVFMLVATVAMLLYVYAAG
jgi:hypothetical protein